MIFKRGKHWHMDVSVNGVRYREALDTTDRREALSLEKKRVGDIQQGKAASASGKEFARKPFSDAAKVFLEERVGHVAERTLQFEDERLRPLKAFFGDKPLGKIKAEDIKAYQKQRIDSGRSNKTVNMEVGVLRLMMKRAKVWSVVSEDVKLFPKRARAIGKVLSPEEKGHLFRTAAGKPEWLVAHCAAVIAVSTTCRGVELKNLRWSNVDLFAQVMRVGRSKTDAGHRTIPLNGDAVKALARLNERAITVGSTAPDHYVFPACENGNIDPAKPQKSWRSAWRSLTKAAGFPGYRFHDLRHQSITEMSEAGASDATIMAVAGHIDRSMLEHYSHVRMAAKRSILDRLESGLMQPEVEASSELRQVN